MESNKVFGSEFHDGYRRHKAPEEGRREKRPKRCGDSNQDEDTSPKMMAKKAKPLRRIRRSSMRPPGYAESENGGYVYTPPSQMITFDGYTDGYQTEI